MTEIRSYKTLLEYNKSIREIIEQLVIVANEINIKRIAIVGGAIRDLLIARELNILHFEPNDIDIVIEGEINFFIQKLKTKIDDNQLKIIRLNYLYETAELKINNFQVDIASAREEIYPAPAENPKIALTTLKNDLRRRDITINSLALDLYTYKLIDLYEGLNAIKDRKVEFIHDNSVEEDPTRIIRCARYCTNLNFSISRQSQDQITNTLRKWPWAIASQLNKSKAPPSIGSRLRMELELLFKKDNWKHSINLLQSWGALLLLDKTLQKDLYWERRVTFLEKEGIDKLTSFLAGSQNPDELAKRLDLPKKDQRLMTSCKIIKSELDNLFESKSYKKWNPSDWCKKIEGNKWTENEMSIIISLKHPLWRYLFLWQKKWRKIKSSKSATQLIRMGWKPGKSLKLELERLRIERLDNIN